MQSLWMLAATFLFAAMGVCVKLASGLYSTSEIVMYRGAIGMLFILAFAGLTGGTLKTAHPREHLQRSLFGVVALWLWFHAIGLLPLAMAMTLNYTAPIWMAAILFFSALRKGQGFDWGLAAALGFSFAGVVLLLRPAMQTGQSLAGLLALASGVLSAFAYLQVRHLGRLGEPEYRIVFYFSAAGAAFGLGGALAGAESGPASGVMRLIQGHSGEGLLLLGAIGASAVLAQIAMTRAYRYGNALLNANMHYTGIVFSSLWGIVIWNDALGWTGWSGIAIIIAGGSAATYYNFRQASARSDAISSEI